MADKPPSPAVQTSGSGEDPVDLSGDAAEGRGAAGDGGAGGTRGPIDALADAARARAARATVEAAAAAAVATAGKVATGVLDGLETLLFGRVGGAEAAVKADDPDPVARLRARYEADVAAVKRATGEGAAEPAVGKGGPIEPALPVRPPKEDPVARARAELEALKAARGGPKADGPIKKTL